jgi:hypothetical protein
MDFKCAFNLGESSSKNGLSVSVVSWEINRRAWALLSQCRVSFRELRPYDRPRAPVPLQDNLPDFVRKLLRQSLHLQPSKIRPLHNLSASLRRAHQPPATLPTTDDGQRTSFVPQNLHGIKPGRRERRVESREKADSECRERDPQPIQRAGVEGYGGERVDIRLERDQLVSVA